MTYCFYEYNNILNSAYLKFNICLYTRRSSYHMATSAISTYGRSFKSSLGNDELSLTFDSKYDRLRIEVASSSRFEKYCIIISKQEVREITGEFVSKQLNFIT